jgi:hypothetical protein
MLSYSCFMSRKINSLKGWVKGHKRLFLGLGGALLIILAIILIITGLSAPSVGSIRQGNPDNLSGQATDISGQYSGHYISFTYPDGYHSVAAGKPRGMVLETANYYSSEHLSRDLVVSVQRESLNNETGLSLRQKEPNLYKPLPAAPGHYIFQKVSDNDSEITAFFAQGDKVATLAITAPGQQDLKSDFDTVLSSFNWIYE